MTLARGSRAQGRGYTRNAVQRITSTTDNPDLRDLRAHAPDGRARDPLRAERRGLRRRLPALPGQAVEYGWVKEGSPTSPTLPRVAAPPPAQASARSSSTRRSAPETRSRPSRSCAGSPSPSSRWSRRPTSSTASAYRRTVGGIAKSLGEPKACDRAALGREVGARRHDRLGHLVVPVPRQPRLGAAGPARRARARPRRARVPRSGSGTRTSRRRPARSGHRAPLAANSRRARSLQSET